MTDPLLARIVRQNGQTLLDKAVDTLVTHEKADGQHRLSLPRKIAGAALMKVATRSVPGAIVVGGFLLAKHLHDRKKAHETEAEATAAPAPETR